MKILICILLGMALAGNALGQGMTKSEIAARNARAQAIFCVDPIRKVDGKVHDLTPLFQWHYNKFVAADQAYLAGQKPPTAPPAPMPGWLIVQGDIQAITRDGVILEHSERLLFLKNWPGAAKAKDKDYMCVFAHEAGTYTYIGQTMAAYDYGVLPTAEEMTVMKAAAAKAEVERKAQAQAEAQRKIDEGKARTAAFLKAQQEKKEKEQKEKEAKEKEAKEKEQKEEKKD